MDKVFLMNIKIKFLQALCYIGGLAVLIFNFNLHYLFFAWLYSWIVVHVGMSMGLHRCFSHQSWQPKNKFILIVIHILSVLITVGPSIPWAATHRNHHKFGDTDKDPHCIRGTTVWQKIKLWFNYVPYHKVNPRIVIDLLKDPYHKFFNKHYFKILTIYGIGLYLIHPDLFMYGYLVSTMFTLHTISWIVVGAHLFGYKDVETEDDSKNTYIMGLYSWGEGWHNNHHAVPWSYAFGWNKKQPDLGKYFIEILAEPKSLKTKDHYQN